MDRFERVNSGLLMLGVIPIVIPASILFDMSYTYNQDYDLNDTNVVEGYARQRNLVITLQAAKFPLLRPHSLIMTKVNVLLEAMAHKSITPGQTITPPLTAEGFQEIGETVRKKEVGKPAQTALGFIRTLTGMHVSFLTIHEFKRNLMLTGFSRTFQQNGLATISMSATELTSAEMPEPDELEEYPIQVAENLTTGLP